jgi:hypothetical protein
MKKHVMFLGRLGMMLAFGAIFMGCDMLADDGDKTGNGSNGNAGEIYDKMIAKQSQYPQGMSWTDSNSYTWSQGGSATGCVAFAHILSDAAFGTAPDSSNRTDFSNMRVGDIIRFKGVPPYYGTGHSAIILKINGSVLTLAEGNWNYAISWTRTIDITSSTVASTLNYYNTRY